MVTSPVFGRDPAQATRLGARLTGAMGHVTGRRVARRRRNHQSWWHDIEPEEENFAASSLKRPLPVSGFDADRSNDRVDDR